MPAWGAKRPGIRGLTDMTHLQRHLAWCIYERDHLLSLIPDNPIGTSPEDFESECADLIAGSRDLDLLTESIKLDLERL